MNEIVVLGEDRVQQLFAMAPKAFGRAMTHWMWSERKHFLGNKKYRGEFRRSLDIRPRKYMSGRWSKGIGSAFTGNVANREQLEGLRLSMGITDKWQQRIPYAEFLSKGGTIFPKRADWLIIPNYKNLKSRGLFGRIGSSGVSKLSFNKLFNFASGNIENPSSRWSPNLELSYPVFKNGKMFYFGNTSGETYRNKSGKVVRRKSGIGRLHGQLLFIGVKSVSIGKQFDFVSDFLNRQPIFVKNANNMVDKTINEIDKKVGGGFTLVS